MIGHGITVARTTSRILLASVLMLSSLLVLSANRQPVDLVWPWLDSGNSRWFYFNTATRPFGMVNLSPDTELDGAWGSGYRYNTEEIKGFNHVHAWQLAGLSVMPVSSIAALRQIEKDYYSAFSHANETVGAGFHQVKLDRYDINVELTSTTRVGFHRYDYPDEKPRQILLDMQGKFGPVDLSKGSFRQISPRNFAGHVINEPTLRRPRATPIFFHIELNTDVESWEESDGAVLLDLEPRPDIVLMKVALSYVDEKGAQQNLRAELDHWDFDRVLRESKDEWNRWLSRILVSGGSPLQQTRFYTDLFHSLQGRRTLSDVDGRYSDQTSAERKIGQIPLTEGGVPQFRHFNSDSFWGAQWTIQTLWPLVYPDIASDFTNSMLLMYRDGGYIPRGPSGGNYTHVMTGASSTPFFVSNYMKGLRDFDVHLAYEGLKKNHMPGGTMGRAGYEHNSSYSGGLEFYIERGYVPYPIPQKNKAFHQDGAGQTMEYAYQDWTLAQLANALGKAEDYNYFLERSQNYKNLFDKETGYIRPRTVDGSWRRNFDPFQYRHGFVESNAAQMTWFAPHDYAGLAQLMGGRDKAVEKLNTAFTVAEKQGFTAGKSHDSETEKRNRRIPINYGNQPSIQTAFIFNELGAPHLTQKWSRKVVDAVYSQVSEHHGYNGDEDQGLMGSLSVLMKIGLFQLNGGTSADPVYQIGSPIFDRVQIATDPAYYSGKTFIIETENNSAANIYIQKITLNGAPLSRHFLRHSEIIRGGTLTLTMGSEPPHQETR